MRIDSSRSGAQRGAAFLLLPLFGLLAWTTVWSLLRREPVIGALADPLHAPRAWFKSEHTDPVLGLSGLVSGVAVILLGAAMLSPRSQAIFGDARFARRPELKRAGLLARRGLLLGRLGGWPPRYLRHDGLSHLLLCAPTRSGKGVGVVTPNLLSWSGSVVVLDIKDESHGLTSGFRAAHGTQVFRFSPGDTGGRTHRYNPLDAVRRGSLDRIADLQRIAHLIVPESGGDGGMWSQEARSLFVGLCLYVLDTPRLAPTLGQVLRILQTNRPLNEVAQTIVAKEAGRLDPACIGMLASFAAKASKEASGVRSTLTGRLELYGDPRIDAATSASDFDPAALRRQPTSIYVSVALDEIERCAPLIALFFQQLVGTLTRVLPGPDEPFPVLLLIDEFASLGRMDVLVDQMPFLAGFNVRLALVVQGLAQLDRLYGPSGRELILQNAGLQLFFATNDQQTSSYVSGRLGTYTGIQTNLTRSTPMLGGGGGSVSTGRTLHARQLRSADEIRRLDRRRGILFVEGARPVELTKIIAHRDPNFTSRGYPPVVTPAIAVARQPAFRPTQSTRDVHLLSDDDRRELEELDRP